MVDTEGIARVLARSPMFRSTEADDLMTLAATARVRHIESGEALFVEGAPGDFMALVVRGALSVRSERPGEMTEVSVIRPGEVVGEMACLDPAPRSATVRAAEGTWIIEIDRAAVVSMQQTMPAVALSLTREVIHAVTARVRETNRLIDRLWTRGVGEPEVEHVSGSAGVPAPRGVDLRKLQTFAAYSDRELATLVAVAPPRRYPEGHVLCREGAAGASCFILVWGSVDVTKTVAGKERLLGTLEPGALVGQMALVDAHRRSATVRASGDVIALELQRHDFERLIVAASPLAVRFQEQIAVAGIRQLRGANARLVRVRHELEAAVAWKGSRHDRSSRQAPPKVPHELGLAYMDVALREWGMNLQELDSVAVVHPEGIMTQAEIAARMRRGR